MHIYIYIYIYIYISNLSGFDTAVSLKVNTLHSFKNYYNISLLQDLTIDSVFSNTIYKFLLHCQVQGCCWMFIEEGATISKATKALEC